jgi:hypothetical protein
MQSQNGDYSRLIPIGLISNGYRPKLISIPISWSYMTIPTKIYVMQLTTTMHQLKSIEFAIYIPQKIDEKT